MELILFFLLFRQQEAERAALTAILLEQALTGVLVVAAERLHLAHIPASLLVVVTSQVLRPRKVMTAALTEVTAAVAVAVAQELLVETALVL